MSTINLSGYFMDYYNWANRDTKKRFYPLYFRLTEESREKLFNCFYGRDVPGYYDKKDFIVKINVPTIHDLSDCFHDLITVVVKRISYRHKVSQKKYKKAFKLILYDLIL